MDFIRRHKALRREIDGAEYHHDQKRNCTRLGNEDSEYVHDRRYYHDGETERGHRRRRHDDNSTQVLADIPLGVVCNILSWLPFKSLARFRAVSGSWNLLIQSPYFIDLHSRNRPLAFIFPRTTFRGKGITNFHIVEKLKDEWVSTQTPLEHSLRGRGLKLVATCNDLLCLVNRKSHVLLIYIYNPITRSTDHITLPVEVSNPWDWGEGMQLGYDSETNKYKFVSIHINTNLVIHVITLGENRWRKLYVPMELGVGVKSMDSHRPVSVKGEIYWMVEMKDERVLVAMDISNEEIRVIKFHQNFLNIQNFLNDPSEHSEWCIVPFRNHVSLILRMSMRIHIWDLVDNRHGIWSHRASISKDHLRLSDYNKIRVLGTTKDENLLLGETCDRYSDRLYSYNLKTKDLTLQSIKDDLIPDCHNLFSFVPSLASTNL